MSEIREMSIDDKTLDKVAELAMLSPTPDQKTKLKGDLEKIIGMMAKLDEVDTTAYEPCRQINDHAQELRKDQVTSNLSKEAALSNAKHTSDGFFLVPKVIKQ